MEMINMKAGSMFLSLIIIGLALSLVHLIYSYPVVLAAESLDRYWSVLTGGQQVPPIKTEAHGFVGLKFKDDLSKLVYIVNGENIGNITGINLYQGGEDQNGSVVLDLLNGTRALRKSVDKLVDVNKDGQVTGTLSIGGATKDDLHGPLKGKSLSELNESIVNGTVYIDIKTKKFPSGEILGNSFVSIDRLFPDFTDFKWN